MNLNESKILVTGASGLIGSNLIQRLEKISDDVRIVAHKKILESFHAFETIRGDLTDSNFCQIVTRDMDIVFHCAANSSGAAAHSANPTSMAKDNTIMNLNLLDACYKNKVKKFIWLASTTGYPEGNHPMIESEMFEGDPFDKYFAVGWMKRYTEKLCQLYSVKSDSQMTAVVLRPTNIFGPNDKIDPSRSHVLPALIRKVVERQNPIEIWGDGTEVRDVLYIDDMIDAMIVSAEQVSGFDQFNIGMGKSYTVLQLLEIIQKVSGYSVPYKFVPTTAKMIPFREVSIKKAKNILGWEPKTTLEEGILKTYSWMQKELALDLDITGIYD